MKNGIMRVTQWIQAQVARWRYYQCECPSVCEQCSLNSSLNTLLVKRHSHKWLKTPCKTMNRCVCVCSLLNLSSLCVVSSLSCRSLCKQRDLLLFANRSQQTRILLIFWMSFIVTKKIQKNAWNLKFIFFIRKFLW